MSCMDSQGVAPGFGLGAAAQKALSSRFQVPAFKLAKPMLVKAMSRLGSLCLATHLLFNCRFQEKQPPL